MTWLNAGTSRVRIPPVARDFIFSDRPHRLWEPPILLFSGVKQPVREVNRALASSGEVTYEWSHSSAATLCLRGLDRDNISKSKVYETLLLFASHVPTVVIEGYCCA